MASFHVKKQVVLYGFLTLVIIGIVLIKNLHHCFSNSSTGISDKDIMLLDSQGLSDWQQALNRKQWDLRERELRILQQERKLHIGASVNSHLPVIFCLTPTYARPEQKAELTRLSQTFLHVPKLHWVVVEDSNVKTKLVANLLTNSQLVYTHLNIMTPPDYKMKSSDPNWLKPRGTLQRNLALKWIRNNFDYRRDQGVLYFADDDNTYDLQLFAEMRYTQRASVWPVGLVGGLKYESPICKNGKVTGWFTYWKPERPFAMDMAGFAVNVKLLFEKPEAEFDIYVQRGYQESSFLTKIITIDELEAKACDKILVWHTRTEKTKLKNEEKLRKLNRTLDLNMEV